MELIEPRTVREALRILAEEPAIVPLAGCTDVFVELHGGVRSDRRYLSLWRLDALRGIHRRGGALTIGALTTYTDIMRSAIVRMWIPMLSAAAAEIGAVQIQNRGTIGGNVANASPAGDTLPVLLAADAVVVLGSVEGERRVPVGEFFVGYRQTARRADELVTAIEIPPVVGRQWFRKVGTRAAQAISKVVMAGVRGESIALAAGSVAPVPLRLRGTERVLSTGGTLAEAQLRLVQEIAPIDDIRSTAEYRRRVVCNLLEAFWNDTALRCGRRRAR